MHSSVLSALLLVSLIETYLITTKLNRRIVFFVYPETANVRLEDMNLLFGDATSVMPTPETIAEAESLFSGASPVPSLDIQRPGAIGPDHAIPGLNINPPSLQEESSGKQAETSEGVGGWISNLVKRGKGNGEGDGGGQYRKVDQSDGR